MTSMHGSQGGLCAKDYEMQSNARIVPLDAHASTKDVPCYLGFLACGHQRSEAAMSKTGS
jgi:hypothetical protein